MQNTKLTTSQLQLANTIEHNLIDYVTNSSNTDAFIEEHIASSVELTEEQHNAVGQLLMECQRDWEQAPCDAEGATKEQDAVLDAIVEKCAIEIALLVA